MLYYIHVKFRNDKLNNIPKNVNSRFYLELPLVEAHSHTMNSPAILMSNPINADVANKIYSLVCCGRNIRIKGC